MQSGLTANSGTIPAITSERDLIVSDELNHASIIDGVRLSKASRAVFPHRDVDGLEKVLREARASGGPNGPYEHILVITDGVFSMDGDIAPLAGICDVADRYEAAVMVDDAHASGVLGRNGRGTVDHFDLHGRVDIQVGTLSKAVGVMGGYIAGRQHLKDYLDPALPAAALLDLAATGRGRGVHRRDRRAGGGAGADRATLGQHPLLQGGPAGARLRHRASARRRSRRSSPATRPRRSSSPRGCSSAGVFATSVVFPTVALGKARVRTIVTSEHTRDDLQTCLDAFATVGRELRLI